MTRRRIVTAEESDVHSRWRRIITCTSRPGYCKAAKRRTNRRERREGRAECRTVERDYR